jgi:heme A synthase
MQMLFMAHSGVRYLVLLTGIVALLYFGYAVVAKKGNDRTARIIGAAFTGFIDLQVVLGLLMVAFGLFYSALIGHMFMMIAAAVVAHVAMVFGRSAPNAARGNAVRLLGVATALVLIIGGIMAIGRAVFGTGSPTLI